MRQYDEQLRTPSAARPSPVSTPNVQTSIGQALRYAGNQVGAAGERVQANRAQESERQRQEAVQSEMQSLRMARISLEADNETYFDGLVADAAEDGSGLHEQIQKDMAQQRQDLLGKYSTPEAQKEAQFIHAGMEARMLSAASNERARRMANVATRQAGDALTAAEKIVNRDAGRYGETVANMADVVQGLRGLNADQKAQLIMNQGHAMAVAAGEGSVERDPAGTLKDLMSEKPKATWIGHLDLDDRQRLTNAAQSEMRRREQEYRARQAEAREILRQDVADAFTAKTYGQSAVMPTRARYIAAYGKEGAARYSQDSRRFQIYDMVSSAAVAPPAQALEQLRAMAPTGQAGAAEQAQVYEEAVRLYQHQRKAVEADPAGSLMGRVPGLSQLYQAATAENATPAATAAYAAKMVAAQQAAGIAAPQILPAETAEALARQLQSDPAKPGQRAARLAMLANVWGHHYGDVLHQVAPKLDGIGQILPYVPARTAARLDALSADPKPIMESLAATGLKSDMEDAVNAELEALDATMPAGVVAGGAAIVSQYREAVSLLAADLVRGGMNPKKAARQAAQEAIDSQYEFRGRLRIPRGQNAGAIEAGASAVIGQLVKSGQFQMEHMPHERPEDAQADARALIRKEGFWIANGDESGAVLATPLGVVNGADGRPITRTWAQLEQIAAPTRQLDATAGAIANAGLFQ